MSDIKQRTIQQNRALHKYFTLLAEALNDAGWETKRVLSEKPEVEIPWTPVTVKELLWRGVMQPMTEKFSTTELDRTEINAVYEVLDRHISGLTGVHVEFPSDETDQRVSD